MTHMHRKTLTAGLLVAVMGCAGGPDGDTDNVIDSRGGTISSEDGRLTLDVPEGALDAGVAVTISLGDEDPEDAVGPSYQVLPEGTSFRIPATVTYNFDGLDMDDTSSVLLVVEKNDTWFYMADQAMHSDSVTASAVYLSSFSVVGTSAADAGSGDGDGDGT
jgi:hypothetical protein